MNQTILLGLVQGGVYAMSSAGLVLIFSIAGVVNLAHGETVVFGGLIAYYLSVHTHLPFAIIVLLGALASGILGLLFAGLVFDRLRGASEMTYLIASIGVIFVMTAVMTKMFGDNPQSVRNAPTREYLLGGVHLPQVWLIMIIASVLVTLLLMLFIGRTAAGQAMRAMAVNPFAAELMGISRRRYEFAAFGIGSAIAGLGGALLASTFPISPDSGQTLVFYAFVVVIFAGVGSIAGSLLGGMVLGIVGALAAIYISSGYADSIIFLFLLIVLVVRPDGLFSRKASHA